MMPVTVRLRCAAVNFFPNVLLPFSKKQIARLAGGLPPQPESDAIIGKVNPFGRQISARLEINRDDARISNGKRKPLGISGAA